MVTGTGERSGTKLSDRPEYKDKQKPLTRPPDATVFEAVSAMTDKNYGCVIVTDEAEKVIGVHAAPDQLVHHVARSVTTPMTFSASSVTITQP